MNSTPSLNKALALAQSKMQDAELDGVNPFHKSKYATLSSVRKAVIGPLTENGLSITQITKITGDMLVLVTRVAHESGESIESELPLKPKDSTSQSLGAAMTYARRFALAGICGISSDVDDDGEMDRRGDERKRAPKQGRGDGPDRQQQPAGDERKPAPATDEQKEAKHHERVQKIRDRLLEMTARDAESARKILSGILPGVDSCQHLTPDQAWRVKIALSVMKMKDNSLEAAKTHVANVMKLPWVDKMSAADRKAATDALVEKPTTPPPPDTRPEIPSTDNPKQKDPF